MNIRTAKRWTKEESERCFRLFAQGKSPNVIGHLLDRTKRAIETHLRENRRDPSTALKVAPGGGRFVPYVPPITKEIPARALAERERAYGSNRTLNQTYLGDPLPGRSALERMNRGGRV